MTTKKYVAVIMLVFCLSFGAYTPKAHAGIPVIDFSNLIESILTFIETLENVINTYTQIDNQITQIENQVKGLYYQAQNLKNMDLKNSLRNLSTLRGNLSRVKQLVLTTKAIPFQYDNVANRYDQLYKKVDKQFLAYSGMTLEELKGQSTDILAQTSEAARDAMLAHGLIVDIEEDGATLEDLLANSDGAEGALEAAQVNNQIMALNTNQLMRLQAINAASARLQASQYEEQVQRRLMTDAETDRYYDYLKNPTNTLDGGGGGPGLVDFK